MRISEIFHSVQGEGELTGIPSVFVRTSGCNLRCTWCDTPYASWNPEGRDWSIDEILAEIEQHPARHVVLTGGEPMIAKGIHELAAELRARNLHITIETAATMRPGGIACDLASLSPKLGNSTPTKSKAGAWAEKHEKHRLQPEVIAAWIRDYDFQLKFVVSSERDWAEILALTGLALDEVPRSKILLMPEGTDSTTLASRRSWLLDLCKENGFRYCHRLHIDLFGNTRGT